MAVLRLLTVDLHHRCVHFDRCDVTINVMLDVDGDETNDPAMACYVVARIPDEFRVPGGQWINIEVDARDELPMRH